jgi:hypothetical protein
MPSLARSEFASRVMTAERADTNMTRISTIDDPRASGLISRIGEDVSFLTQDVRNLLSHTARHTLPDRARDLALSARRQLHQPGALWLGGALAVGFLAAGTYLALRGNGHDTENAEAQSAPSSA